MFRILQTVRMLGVLSILAFASASSARADLFNVSFFNSSNTSVGSGQFSTSGTCLICIFPSTLTAPTFEFGDLVFNGADTVVGLLYFRPANALSATIADSSTGGVLLISPTSNFVVASPDFVSAGRVVVTAATTPAPVPEPTSIVLFGTTCALMGWRFRKRLRT